MFAAIATGVGLVAVILGTLFTSKAAFFVLVAAAVLIAQWELYRGLASHGARPAESLGLVAGALLLVAAAIGGSGALGFALTMSVLATFAWFATEPDHARAMESVAATLYGLVYVPLLGSFVVLLRSLPHGPRIVICYIGAVALYDIGAYAAGSRFGKRPMAPTVSPHKTWEGLAGATVTVLVVAAVAGPHLPPFTFAGALALAIAVAAVAPLGDLAESLIKRDMGIKDMGSILPGHGGLLDRIDALLLVAPAAYVVVRAIVL